MINILQQNKINFKSLKKNIFKYGCEVTCEELKELLQAIDKWLMKTRDKSIYRHKGHRKTCIKTLMGEVNDARLLSLANERMQNFNPTNLISSEDLYKELGITKEDMVKCLLL